jgi:hypothetical protein
MWPPWREYIAADGLNDWIVFTRPNNANLNLLNNFMTGYK